MNNQIQINPVEVARVALMFLARAQFNASERQAFDAAEALLNAIVTGQVQLVPQAAAAPLPLDQPTETVQ